MSPENKSGITYAFFGTPQIAATTLQLLSDSGFTPSVVVTNPDKPQGRKHILTPSPVKAWALENNIPVIETENADELYDQLQRQSWDCFIVVAYGHILPEKTINLPTRGTLNIHYSLLPRWRGASPVEAAILAGDAITGVTIQQMVYKLDAGDIVAQSSIELEGDETTIELKEIMTTVGAELLADILPGWLNQDIVPVPQDETQVTKSGKFKKEDMELLSTDDDLAKWRKYRALIERKPYFMNKGKRVVIADAHFSDGHFIIDEVIPEGKTRMPFSEYI